MSALDHFALDCQFSILSIVLADPELIDGLDLQAEDFTDGGCADLWQCVSAHRTNSEAVIAETLCLEAALLARDIKAKNVSAPSNLHRHIRALRRAKQTMDYAQTVRAKLGRKR